MSFSIIIFFLFKQLVLFLSSGSLRTCGIHDLCVENDSEPSALPVTISGFKPSLSIVSCLSISTSQPLDDKAPAYFNVLARYEMKLQQQKYNEGRPSFSNRTLEEEDIAFMQYAGLYPLNKYHTVYYFSSATLTIFMITGMVVGSYMAGDLNVTFETTHILLIAVNMVIQNVTCHYHHNVVDTLLRSLNPQPRSINSDFFSYGETMDENTKMMINQLNNEKRARKKMYGKLFKIQVASAALGLIVKRILLILFGGPRNVDGENGLLYQAPVSVYMPFGNYWVPYVIGIIMSHNSIITIALTAMASATSFIRFSEELLQQLQIIKLGLRNVIARASNLYTVRCGRSYPSMIGEIDDDFDRCLETCLTKSVEHHAIIIKLFEDFKKMMTIPLLTVIFDGGALICMSMALLITSDNTAMKLSMPSFIAAELYYTYIYCSYGEKLTNLFAEIGHQLYLNDWLTHRKVMKPYMIIIKAYSFYPKKLSAGGFTSPNLESFGNVLRTAYSLLNFLVTQQ